jgi:hypothetical protein
MPSFTCLLAKKHSKEGIEQTESHVNNSRDCAKARINQLSNFLDRKRPSKLAMNTQNEEDAKRYKPRELLSSL